jgi:hypothetical protein
MVSTRIALVSWALGWSLASTMPARSQVLPDLEQEVRVRTTQIEAKLIAWRRDIHKTRNSASRKRARRVWLQITLPNLGLTSGLAWAVPALLQC